MMILAVFAVAGFLFRFQTSVDSVASPSYHSVPFNHAAWLKGTGLESPNSDRLLMKRDLMARFVKVGMSRSEVEKLLGKPDVEVAHRENQGLSLDVDQDDLLRVDCDISPNCTRPPPSVVNYFACVVYENDYDGDAVDDVIAFGVDIENRVRWFGRGTWL